MQIIRLEDYRAVAPAQPLRLGSWDSYGIETLQIQPGAGWQGLELVATFVTPDGATQVPVPPDGVLTVPPEATARPLPADQPGRLVFAGMAEGCGGSAPTWRLWCRTTRRPTGRKAGPPRRSGSSILTKSRA